MLNTLSRVSRFHDRERSNRLNCSVLGWNFVGHLKYRHQHERFPTLAFPHPVDPDEEPPQSAIVRHPHLKRFAEIGRHFHAHKLEPPEGWPKVEDGTVKVQVVRSSADWSHGILTEHSILNAYRQIILESKHCLYIENQFFITTTGAKKTPVSNSIGAALVQRVVSAAKAYQRFKVVIVIPAVPGFAGDLDAKGSSGTLCILGAQLKSIEDIFNQIRAEGVKPEDFIEFYNLRSYDRINHDPARIRRMEEKSGVTWYQAQAALARYGFFGSASRTLDMVFTLVSLCRLQTSARSNADRG